MFATLVCSSIAYTVIKITLLLSDDNTKSNTCKIPTSVHIPINEIYITNEIHNVYLHRMILMLSQLNDEFDALRVYISIT